MTRQQKRLQQREQSNAEIGIRFPGIGRKKIREIARELRSAANEGHGGNIQQAVIVEIDSRMNAASS